MFDTSSVQHVGVIGAGYVGLTTATGMHHLGHRVTLVDIDSERIATIRRGVCPLREPELGPLLNAGLEDGRLSATTDSSALATCDTVFVCVPTPTGADDDVDLNAVDGAVALLRGLLPRGAVVAVKSTVPVGTTSRIAASLNDYGIAAVSNPEFLRESHAVHDFLHPDRIVVGASDDTSAQRVADLYTALHAPILRMDTASAELAKYASNAFLGVKASYVNAMAEICDDVGADIRCVEDVMAADPRIGPAFLRPGPGWGGSCLPKDTKALLSSTRSTTAASLLRASLDVNAAQVGRVVDKIRATTNGDLRGRRIGLLGLAFKAGTSDTRDSPALAIAAGLAQAGALLTAYDPGVTATVAVDGVNVVDDPYLVAKDAAVVVVLTEWDEFRELDWSVMGDLSRTRAVVDMRNILDHSALMANGFHVATNGTVPS
ncbi:UDP-glucose dehydrogenase family protein [Rhodococcus sp. NPDC058521]|uniref:UDP-glucose dehydrogenase family protein n=1 Tax=Rhodococcus sp. NPDC058521 TaxID=3346536 RepID=UPI003655CEB8